MLKMLDCFCGLGGVSDGFAVEGFDVTGIDIECMKQKGYKYKFIQADLTKLNGSDFRGYNVIWGSPPCRDFSYLGIVYGKGWKDKPNPQRGLLNIVAFFDFVTKAEPDIWIMENVAMLKKYLPLKPNVETLISYGKRHVFYGNFPAFLITRDMTHKVRGLTSTGRDTPIWKDRKLASWLSAKIPLSVSQGFAKACREVLEVSSIVQN